MTKTLEIVCFTFYMLMVSNISASEDPFQKKALSFESIEKMAEQIFLNRQQTLDALWRQQALAEKQKWLHLEEQVMQRWGEFHSNTNTVWVSYSDDLNAFNKVDFLNGYVQLEALIDSKSDLENKREILRKQLNTLINTKDSSGRDILKDLLLPLDINDNIKQETVSSNLTNPTTLKIKLIVPMLSDHMQKQASRYASTIVQEANAANINPALVFAVIHTESAFNPMATSAAPAYGLMQLMPQWAAKEAYIELFGQEKVLSPQFLYQPEINIKLGTTYLKLLKERYFNAIDNAAKQRDIIISAYNWGPTAMKQRFLSQVDTRALSHEKLSTLLQNRLPQETANYLIKVKQRAELYQNSWL